MALARPHPVRTTFHFLLNGEVVAVSGVAPQTTLLEFLRETRRLTGTKEGCAEGDCGACTVVLAERGEDGAPLTWKPVNACIRLLPSVAGRAVFTVESLRGDDGELHPVQRALVACHGSQCGFCTPGFAMSLFGMYKNAARPDDRAVEDALSGNLCRCTGYRPIVAAARAMYDDPRPGTGWRAPGLDAEGRPRANAADAALAVQLAALDAMNTTEDATGHATEHAASDTVSHAAPYTAEGRRWWAPRTTAALATVVAAHPDARIVAGATDVGLWVTKQHRDLGDLVYTGDAADLRAIRTTPTHVAIGAAATLAEAFAALADTWPELDEAWARFASVPIRNSGTLGGNIANGSPIGDSMPALIALGASVVLRHGESERELPLESFYVAYQKTARRPGEFVAAIHVPLRAPGSVVRAYKVSKRFDQDISAVFACIALALDGARVAAIRIGCGGVAAIPVRATRTEQTLVGRTWDDATAEAAARVLETEFAPIDDMRASAAYRRTVLANLLRRFRVETAGAAHPTRVEQVCADAAP